MIKIVKYTSFALQIRVFHRVERSFLWHLNVMKKTNALGSVIIRGKDITNITEKLQDLFTFELLVLDVRAHNIFSLFC